MSKKEAGEWSGYSGSGDTPSRSIRPVGQPRTTFEEPEDEQEWFRQQQEQWAREEKEKEDRVAAEKKEKEDRDKAEKEAQEREEKEKRDAERKEQAALVIQRTWRSFLDDLVIRRVVKVQSLWRMVKHRRDYLRLRNAARMVQARFQYLRLRKATRMVQERFRYLRLRNATLFLQMRFRFLRLRKAAMVAQLRWRARQEMKLQRASFLSLQRTALAIQTQYRMVRAQEQYKDTLAKGKADERSVAEEKTEQEEASVREKNGEDEDGDEMVTMRPEVEQLEASVRVGEVEVLRPGSGDKELVASPPHNVDPDK